MISLPEAGIYSVIGIAVVFLVLIFLMCSIFIMSAILRVLTGSKKVSNETVAQPAPVAQAPKVLAKGSCGQTKLFDVPDATAAMLMAIVADKLETPLNELRFKSIKEIK